MGKQRQLKKEESKKIMRLCSERNTILEISKLLERNHRTIKKFIYAGEVIRLKSKRTKPKALSFRDMQNLKNTLRKMPHSTSRAIFEKAGLSNVSKSTRNDYSRKFGEVRKIKSTLILTQKHKKTRIESSKKYIKQDFNKVIWIDECRATLGGPDGRARVAIVRPKTSTSVSTAAG